MTSMSQDARRVSRPRILFVSHETTLSGAPIQLVHLAGWLHDRGWKILVATPDRGPISEMLLARGVPTVTEPTLLTDLTHRWLRDCCREFDVVVANTIASWPGVRAAFQERKPALWYLHETLVAIRLIRAIPEMASALTVANLLVTPTRQTARIYQGLTEAPIEVVPYGIPRPLTISAPPSESIRFLALGSFEPRKGQDVLLEAVGKLEPALRARCRFKMAGRALDPEFHRRLRAASAAFPEVEMISAVNHDEALRLLNETDVLVLPSRDETIPIALVEALALRKAVISADVGGVAEWLRDGMNGLIVEPENAGALAEAIARCATNRRLVTRMQMAAGRTFDRHFTLERFGTRFAELLVAVQGKPEEGPRAYLDWVARYDTLTPAVRARLRRQLRLLPTQPLISIILPVYNPDLRFLEAAIDSVRDQIYEGWELCIADDASTDPEVRPFLERIARNDHRVKLTLRERNGHIPACSNSALETATGDFCALLDQDDLLPENALALVALEIDAHPDAGLIYSDEDKVDENGRRSDPFFKPDWNAQLFLGQNYINHLGVYRSDLLRRIGGFRAGFEGSQDYDLALRCIELLDRKQIRHIPKILYHWRAVAGSLAAVPDAKPYAKHAARRAIADHLRRKQQAGSVVRCPENIESHRVIYELPAPAPLVSIIIPTRDRGDLLELCVKSIHQRTDYAPVEIIVVDNASTETRTRELLSRFERERAATVLRHEAGFNYSRLNNLGAAHAAGEILLFLNNDIEVENRAWLTEMVSHAVRPEVGAVGARLWYPDETLQHGGVVLGIGGLAGHAFPRVPRGHPGYYNRAFLQQDCSAVTGACLAIRKQVFQDFNGFDDDDLEVNFSDIDLCLRLRARAYEIVWTPYANLMHRESASRGYQRTDQQQDQFLREASVMRKRWAAELLNDPFYNLNFTLNPPGFEIAFPPRLPHAPFTRSVAIPAKTMKVAR